MERSSVLHPPLKTEDWAIWGMEFALRGQPHRRGTGVSVAPGKPQFPLGNPSRAEEVQSWVQSKRGPGWRPLRGPGEMGQRVLTYPEMLGGGMRPQGREPGTQAAATRWGFLEEVTPALITGPQISGAGGRRWAARPGCSPAARL